MKRSETVHDVLKIESKSSHCATAIAQNDHLIESFLKDGSGLWWTIYSNTRQKKIKTKRYLCLFTSLQLRTVHLEMAYGLDVDSSLNASNRMMSRRGVPNEIVSDNGTNFVAANKESCELVCKDQRVQSSTATKRIKWNFNPPYAPHYGEVFEIMIK